MLFSAWEVLGIAEGSAERMELQPRLAGAERLHASTKDKVLCACVRVRVYVCVCTCVYVCVRACVA